MTTYVLYDEQNNRLQTFAGPHRLAEWGNLPPGWGIEEFEGDVSRGCISLEDVKDAACECPHARLISYTEDGQRYQGCRDCGDYWEVDPDIRVPHPFED